MLTPEESRAELLILEAAKELKYKVMMWSHTDGFWIPGKDEHDGVEDPIAALEQIKKETTKDIIYIFRDAHKYFEVPRVLRLIRDISNQFKQLGKTLILLSPVNALQKAQDIERDVTLIEFELPDKTIIKKVWDNLYADYQKSIGPLTEDDHEMIIEAAMGLTTTEAENTFAKAMVDHKADKIPINKLVLTEKAVVIKKAGILEYWDCPEGVLDVGGLEVLKNFMLERKGSCSKKAREYGLPRPRGIVLAGLPGCGKCVKEDSLVVANGVLTRIADIAPSHKDTKKHVEINVSVQSSEKQEKATQFHWVGLSKTKQIELSNGMVLEGRHEHPVMILDKNGCRDWVKMSDVKISDIVLTRLGADNLVSNSQLPLPYIDQAPAYNDPNGDHRSCGEEKVNLPSFMTEKFAYWLGLLTGDGGWGSPSAINFTQHEKNKVVFEKFTQLMQELFDVKPSVHRQGSKPYMMVAQSGKNHLRRWLASLGLQPYNIHGKIVPDCILKGGTDIWESYIAGLWDTDGSLGNHSELTLKERHIIQDVQTMLWTMGITSTIYPKVFRKGPYKGKKYWRLNIVGGQMSHKFNKIVNRMINKRKSACYKPRELDNDSANASRFGDYTNMAKLVSQLWDTSTKRGVKKDKFVLHTKTNTQFSRRTFTKMHKYMSEYNHELDDYLQWIYTKTIPLPIVSIQDSEANVCDIGVPTNNTFVANGIISHNSLSAKVASNILGVPLIRFDIGKVFGGLVGLSEQNTRTALNQIDAMGSCVVWIDEMEKAFAGMGGSGSNDSGVTQRVVGCILTWLQEKKTPSFVIGTVNRIDNILASMPEMLRKGRWDEIFFIGLPSQKEREEILKIMIKKYWVKNDHTKLNIDYAHLAKESNGFSGAELEESVISGMYKSFSRDTDLNGDFIWKAIMGTNPLSKSADKQLREMAGWAQTNATYASKVSKDDKLATGVENGIRKLNI
jgi:hypothetical protein